MSRKPCEEQRKMLCSLITGQITCGNWAKCSYLFLFLTPCFVFFLLSLENLCTWSPMRKKDGTAFWGWGSCSSVRALQLLGSTQLLSSCFITATGWVWDLLLLQLLCWSQRSPQRNQKNLFCEPCPKEAHQRLSCQNSQGQESPPPLSLIWKDLVVCLLMCSVWLSGY